MRIDPDTIGTNPEDALNELIDLKYSKTRSIVNLGELVLNAVSVAARRSGCQDIHLLRIEPDDVRRALLLCDIIADDESELQTLTKLISSFIEDLIEDGEEGLE